MQIKLVLKPHFEPQEIDFWVINILIYQNHNSNCRNLKAFHKQLYGICNCRVTLLMKKPNQAQDCNEIVLIVVFVVVAIQTIKNLIKIYPEMRRASWGESGFVVVLFQPSFAPPAPLNRLAPKNNKTTGQLQCERERKRRGNQQPAIANKPLKLLI